MNAKQIVEQAARRAADNGVPRYNGDADSRRENERNELTLIIEREFDWVARLVETMVELRRYVIKRGNENRERARGAYGADASWFSAKADTYQRIESKLDEILAAIPQGEKEQK